MGDSFLNIYTCNASIMKICSNITVLPSLFNISNGSVTNTIFVWCGKLTFVVKIKKNRGQQLISTATPRKQTEMEKRGVNRKISDDFVVPSL